MSSEFGKSSVFGIKKERNKTTNMSLKQLENGNLPQATILRASSAAITQKGPHRFEYVVNKGYL